MPQTTSARPRRSTGPSLVLALSGLSATALCLAQVPPLQVPSNIGEEALEGRKAHQLEAIEKLDAFYFFTFSDQLRDSGVTFRNQVTDDGARDYKMVHYDHGNGLAVADVDGDGLYDLYFLTQLGANELWKNLGNGRFRNITAAAGVGLADRISVTASFADYDNDGDADLFVTTVRMGNVLLRNDGEGHFTDVSQAAAVDYRGHSSGAVFLDYDNDGLLDLFVTNVGRYTTDQRGRGGYYVGLNAAFSGHLFPERAEASILYRNSGDGKFQDVSQKTGLVDTSWSGDATFTDLNEDRFPDLYVLNMQGDDHFWENDAGRSFRDKTSDYFPKTSWGAMGVQFFDYDGDGRLDLLVTDMHSDMAQLMEPEKEKLKSTEQVLAVWKDEHLQGGGNNIFGNAFYRNLGGARFEEVSDRIGVENYWPWGVSVGDLNADGWEDLFITASMNYTFRYGVNSLLLNNLGREFVDAEFILGVEPRQGSLVAPWFELDCSGADKEHRHCAGREGSVSIRGARGSRASVLFDLDRDGDLDIVTNEFHSEPQILLSDLSEQTDLGFLEIELQGVKSNRDGLGAKVIVRAGGRAWTRYHNGKSGYLSQSSLPLYFGLGDSKTVDSIEVQWPSGRTQRLEESIPTNERLTIREE